MQRLKVGVDGLEKDTVRTVTCMRNLAVKGERNTRQQVEKTGRDPRVSENRTSPSTSSPPPHSSFSHKIRRKSPHIETKKCLIWRRQGN